VQRPHMVHESVSSSCFQVNSSTTEAPKVRIIRDASVTETPAVHDSTSD